MATSLPPVSAKFIADVEGMLSDLKRAERATQSTAAVMDREVSKLTSGLKKKFSGAELGKGVLQWIGIGSGMALAQTAAEMISGYWSHAAEQAKAVADASTQQLDIVRQIVDARKSEDQLRDAAWKRERDAMTEYFSALKSATNNFQNTGLTVEARGAGYLLDRLLGSVSDADVAAKQAEWQKAFQAFDEIARRIDEKKKTGGVNAALDDFFAPLDAQSEANFKAIEKRGKDTEEMAKRIAEANEWRAKTQRDYNAELEREAEALIKSIATPQEEHAARLKRIQTLYAAGKLTVEQYTRAMTESFQALDAEEMKSVEDALNNFFDDLDRRSTTTLGGVETKVSEFQASMTQMWGNVSDRAGQAFADMVLTGEASFSDLANIVARSMLEIVARMAVINPLLNAMFGGTSGWTALASFWGGGKASGGAVEPGYTYQVNENGQEFFKPSVGGTIMPVGASKGLRSEGKTTIINADLRGASVEAVQRLERFVAELNASLEPRALAAVTNRNLRMAY